MSKSLDHFHSIIPVLDIVANVLSAAIESSPGSDLTGPMCLALQERHV